MIPCARHCGRPVRVKHGLCDDCEARLEKQAKIVCLLGLGILCFEVIAYAVAGRSLFLWLF